MTPSDRDTRETATPGREEKSTRLFLARRAAMRKRFSGKAFVIPSLITVVGIFCGVLSILSAMKGRYEYAALCIGWAFIIDGVDGRVARTLNATSAFGREFDSLSDVISFGVAPAVLAYCWGFSALADDFGVLIVFLFVASGATRLARFNVTTSEEPKRYFQGLPIPCAAGALVSLIYLAPAPVETHLGVTLLSGYVTALAALMVSTVPFFSIKHIKLTDRHSALNLVFLSLAVAFAWYHHKAVLLALGAGYALSGPLGELTRRFFPKVAEQAQEIEKSISVGD